MADITDRLLDALIAREGGYVDHPADRGGPTKYGITQPTLAEWRKREVPASDIRYLMESEARAIYRDRYLTRPGFDRIRHDRLVELLFDAGVNHGPATAAKWLQRAAGVVDDGVIGERTLARVNAPFAEQYLFMAVMAQRLQYFGAIITRDHGQAVFAHGWMNRMAELMGWIG